MGGLSQLFFFFSSMESVVSVQSTYHNNTASMTSPSSLLSGDVRTRSVFASFFQGQNDLLRWKWWVANRKYRGEVKVWKNNPPRFTLRAHMWHPHPRAWPRALLGERWTPESRVLSQMLSLTPTKCNISSIKTVNTPAIRGMKESSLCNRDGSFPLLVFQSVFQSVSTVSTVSVGGFCKEKKKHTKKLKQSLVGHRSFMARKGGKMTPPDLLLLLVLTRMISQRGRKKTSCKSTGVVRLEFHLRNQNKVRFREGKGVPLIQRLGSRNQRLSAA